MTVSFHLSPEQEQLKLGARQFAEEHLRPLAAEVRKEPDPLRRALLARPTFEKAVAAGFLKGLIPAPFGGAAAGGCLTTSGLDDAGAAAAAFGVPTTVTAILPLSVLRIKL